MIVYHGTTVQRARLICREGLQPKPPSRRVWFAEDRKYAFHRAETWARRTNDRAIVLTADVDLVRLRGKLGPGRVMHRNQIIAIDGSVPADALRWHPEVDLSATPAEVAEWVNDVLGPRHDHRVDKRHPGVQRLARWIDHQVGSEHRAELRLAHILEKARKWLPEHFVGVDIDAQRVRKYPLLGTVHVQVQRKRPRAAPWFAKARALLTNQGAKARVRGLKLLVKHHDPDLFDWCAMFLGDESIVVRLAALDAMLHCDDSQLEVVEPLATSDNKRIRAAALAVLAKFAPPDHAPRWFERGLKAPCPCVRIAVVRQLGRLDPAEHRPLFELALTDPNPTVARAARKHAGGRHFAELKW